MCDVFPLRGSVSMIKFADEALIEVSSGKGGNGCIAFRREKYVPKGGPAGGDGGRGGDVVFRVKRNLRTLAHLRYKQTFRARNGGDGEGRNRYGKDGADIIIDVPPGTIIRDAETGVLIKDFSDGSAEESFVFLTGGKGGWGNSHFKSSVNQAPRYAHEGKPGQTRHLRAELNIIADIGLVGLPNAGKSSLLDCFTNARPKIAPYPFTTKIPNLGVLRAGAERDIVIADIPGIIEGASGGAGLGLRFLKHISRTAGLVFIIDLSDDTYLTALDTLRSELGSFSSGLAAKPYIVLCNKLDIEGTASRFAELEARYPGEKLLAMSIYLRQGFDDVRRAITALADTAENAGLRRQAAEENTFLQSRSSDGTEECQYPGQDNSGE